MVRRSKPPYVPPLQDIADWQQEVKDVTPMQSHPITASLEALLETQSPPPSIPMSLPLMVETRLRVHHAMTESPPPPMDENILRRIRLGRMQVERTLDLHGMTQEAAYSALHHFLMHAHLDGCRLVLVVTGKGSVSTQGILRSALPRWCREPSLAPLVIAVHKAHIHHGGDGAYYVRIRKHVR